MTNKKESNKPFSKERLAELTKLVRTGQIGSITIDTSVFDDCGKSLRDGLFGELKQLADINTIELVFSDIVINEIRQHLTEVHQKRIDKLHDLVPRAYEYLAHAVDVEDMQHAIEQLSTPIEIANAEIDQFLIDTAATAVSVREADISEVTHRYFERLPPFDAPDKRSEFPDAIALLSLETWVLNRDHGMLVISKDDDWRRFCESSKTGKLYYLSSLPAALSIINGSPQERTERTKKIAEFIKSNDFKVEILRQFELKIRGRAIAKAQSKNQFTSEIYRAIPNRFYFTDDPFLIRSDGRSLDYLLEISIHCTFFASFDFYRDGETEPFGRAKDTRGVLIPSVVIVGTDGEEMTVEVSIPREDPIIDFDTIEPRLTGSTEQ
ncbi:PIN domain-containing protein [Burkholderia ubonensis]|uniref:PIN domain-containing protein n=1 Tax=Burkholderia ubonensis TaxID=101571 RepID=UPI000A6ABB22|nr:PIN domain-containing protein [Burkholderia ubonensis]